MKIGFFITARLKSMRLKNKILFDLNDKSILDIIIDRCKAVKGIDGVVLCTSTNPQDSVLYKNAQMQKIEFYPGSESDVLDRLLSAALYYQYDAFLSITADNPLFSINLAQIMIDWFNSEKFDYIYSTGLPIGIGSYFLDTKALQVVNKMKKESDTEIWGPFINQPDFFNVGQLEVTNSPFKEEKRLTCDYPEDYKLMKAIYNFFPTNKQPDIQDIISIFKQNSSLWEINKKHQQRIVPENILQIINHEFNKQKSLGKKYAKTINKVLYPGFRKLEIEI